MTTAAFAQVDTITRIDDTTKNFIPVDSLREAASPLRDSAKVIAVMKEHSPKKAALRSLILPGLGQIYNKKYWKLPIVYGALGISGAVFNYNLQWYRRTRFAYKVLVNQDDCIVYTLHGDGELQSNA